MNTLEYKGYKAIVSLDGEDEILVGRLVGLNDVVGFHADSVAALKSAFEEAVDDYVATCEKVGKKPEKPYSGNLMLRVDPAVHRDVALAALLAGKSLNQWSEEVLRKAATATGTGHTGSNQSETKKEKGEALAHKEAISRARRKIKEAASWAARKLEEENLQDFEAGDVAASSEDAAFRKRKA